MGEGKNEKQGVCVIYYVSVRAARDGCAWGYECSVCVVGHNHNIVEY